MASSTSPEKHSDRTPVLSDRLYQSVAVAMLLYAALLWLLNEPRIRLMAPLAIVGFSWVSMRLHRHARPYAAMAVFVWGIWAMATLQAATRNGISNPALYAYPALFLLGGWVLGIRQAVILCVASIAASLLLALAEEPGGLIVRTHTPALMYWLPLAMILAVSMVAMLFILRNHWEGVARTEILNRQLEQKVAEIISLNEQLESRVDLRTNELTEALGTLKRTQNELVHTEKLASLGQLVAGVAHELNTPIGNALIATTTLSAAVQEFDAAVTSGSLKRSVLERFVTQCRDGTQLSERSLRRAADLVHSFKQVAVDQASERRRKFDLAQAVNEIVDTLRPNLKGTPWNIEVDIPAGLTMESFPGPLGQIVINLVMNATLHAFEGKTSGRVRLVAIPGADQTVTIQCNDNGCGISTEHMGRIFDPFFTTKLGRGGSGLGLSIVHRLATQVLGGQIGVESHPGEGTTFSVRLPMCAPESAV